MTFTAVNFVDRTYKAHQQAYWHIMYSGWVPFMREDNIADAYYGRMEDMFPHTQLWLLDGEKEAAHIASLPVYWDGDDASLPDDGWDAMMVRGVEQQQEANTLCAIGITVAPDFMGQGVSRAALLALRELARSLGYQYLIAPVRPNHKHRYPLTPIERYITWTQTDGAPFDPWLRVHWRIGGRIVRPCPRSMRIEHPVAKWEEWTEMRFPETGTYIVPHALVPVEINTERDIGLYIEPNVWVVHTTDQEAV